MIEIREAEIMFEKYFLSLQNFERLKYDHLILAWTYQVLNQLRSQRVLL